MKTFKVAIVDDERPARELLKRLLQDDAQVEIVVECSDGREAISALAQKSADIIFLDIRMPHHDGFEVLESLNGRAPAVIFVTAFDEYAVKAFESNAVDYLLKPFRRERFYETLNRVKAAIRLRKRSSSAANWRALLEYWQPEAQSVAATQTPTSSEYVQRLFVRTGKKMHSLNVAEIDWISSLDHFVEIHAARKSHILYSSLSALETKLDPAKFLRIHRTVVVNRTSIKEFKLEAGTRYIVLKDGTQHRISRRRQSAMGASVSSIQSR